MRAPRHTRPPDQPSSRPRPLIAALLLAAAGTALVLIGLLETVGDVIGLSAIVAGTVLAAPYAELPGSSVSGWWTMLAAGALIALAGAAVGLAVESVGGLLTVLGGTLVAIAIALGYPARSV
jgi:hypothetical protein